MRYGLPWPILQKIYAQNRALRNRLQRHHVILEKVRMRLLLAIFILLGAVACKKASSPASAPHTNSGYPVITDSNYAPVDPPVAPTIGFFSGGWGPKTFSAPPDYDVTVSTSLTVTDS